MDQSQFLRTAHSYIDLLQYSNGTLHRNYGLLFGISSDMTVLLWKLRQAEFEDLVKPEHLLWTLFFLINYCTENTSTKVRKCHEKSFEIGHGSRHK